MFNNNHKNHVHVTKHNLVQHDLQLLCLDYRCPVQEGGRWIRHCVFHFYWILKAECVHAAILGDKTPGEVRLKWMLDLFVTTKSYHLFLEVQLLYEWVWMHKEERPGTQSSSLNQVSLLFFAVFRGKLILKTTKTFGQEEVKYVLCSIMTKKHTQISSLLISSPKPFRHTWRITQ